MVLICYVIVLNGCRQAKAEEKAAQEAAKAGRLKVRGSHNSLLKCVSDIGQQHDMWVQPSQLKRTRQKNILWQSCALHVRVALCVVTATGKTVVKS
jgi:hypothetical protein